uniref:Gag protein n=1 Tax=Drosophila melanogaster TaxID=7227 RepID=Q8IT59_DROME|nr:gag protein [Drosophila melanogaster]
MLGKKANISNTVRGRLGLRSESGLSEIREATEPKEKDQSVQSEDNNPTNTMDSGNDTAAISPIVNSSRNTNLSLQQLLTLVHQLPTYEGPPDNLDRFIDRVDQLLLLASSVDQTTGGKYLLGTIRDKIKGRADEALNVCDVLLTWDDIKINLKRLYSSKKTEEMLVRELHNLPDGLSMGKLYYSAAKIRSDLMSLAREADPSAHSLAVKRDQYDRFCLNTFLTGLKDPLSSAIRNQRPETIEKAYEYGQIELNFHRSLNKHQDNRRRDNPFHRNHPYAKGQPTNSDYNNRYIPRQQNYNNGNNARHVPRYDNNSNNNDSRFIQRQQNFNNNNNRRFTRQHNSHNDSNGRQDRETLGRNPFHNNEQPDQTLSHQNRNKHNPSAPLCNINDDANFLLEASGSQSAT